MKRRLISVALVFAILNSMISISAYALDGIEDEVVTLIPAEGMCVEIDKENYDDIMFVPEEMAKQIAMLFVSDIVDCDDSTKWDHDTEVIDVIPLYNEDITEVTAYTVYLTSGYVIVSAYLDTPSQVTEWSDVAEPVVEDFDASKMKIKSYIWAHLITIWMMVKRMLRTYMGMKLNEMNW